MATLEISDAIVSKLKILQQKLGVDDASSALDKSLNIANFVADTIENRETKLLVERHGRYVQLKEIA